MNKWTCLFLCTDEDWCFQSINLYLITPRLDNLLLKAFEVAVKVPNFSFCCLMFIFFQMWFQLHARFLWLSNDMSPLTLCENKAQMTLCNLVCEQQIRLVGWWITVQSMSMSVRITISSHLFCAACSNLGSKLGLSQPQNTFHQTYRLCPVFFSLDIFISKYRTWPPNSDRNHNLTYCCSFCSVFPCWL